MPYPYYGVDCAYADDLSIASSSEEDIKKMLVLIEEFASWAHLQFNVAKCASLSTSYRGGKRVVLQTEYKLGDRVIPVMKWEDRYKHLGVLIGPDLPPSGTSTCPQVLRSPRIASG